MIDLISCTDSEKRTEIEIAWFRKPTNLTMIPLQLTRAQYLISSILNWFCISIFRSSQIDSDYIYHPINALHLIKRAVFYAKYLHNINQFIPKLSDCTPSLFASDDDLARAYHAVADLREFANLDASQLSKG